MRRETRIVGKTWMNKKCWHRTQRSGTEILYLSANLGKGVSFSAHICNQDQNIKAQGNRVHGRFHANCRMLVSFTAVEITKLLSTSQGGLDYRRTLEASRISYQMMH